MRLNEILGRVWRNKGKLVAGAVVIASGVKGSEIYNGTMARIQGLENKTTQADKQIGEDEKIIDRLTEQEVAQTKVDCVIVNQLQPGFYDCNLAEQQEIQYWQQVIQDIRGGGTGDINITPSQTQ